VTGESGAAVALRPDGLEIAVGTMLGRDPDSSPLPKVGPGRARSALEQAVTTALRRPPCVVSFSGGRDSSAILALASHVAVRDGLDPPIPVTVTYPDDHDSDESRWQELVIAHLRPAEWVRLEQLAPDAVGSEAMGVLRRHGVLFPSNAYLHEPVLRAAAGGSLLSGIGGDELLDTPALPALRMLRRFERPGVGGLKASLRRAGPGWRRRHGELLVSGATWLTPAGRLEVSARGASTERREGRWDDMLRHWVADRYYRAAAATIKVLAQDHDVVAVTPFFEPEVMAALAGEAGWGGFADRASALSRFFGDVLPDELIHRGTKAAFTKAGRASDTTRFLEEWGGEGVDTDRVRPDVLRQVWTADRPDFRTQMLLQQAALALWPGGGPGSERAGDQSFEQG